MKKLICVIPITILICLLLSPERALADRVSALPHVYLIHNGNGWRFISSRSYGKLIFDVSNHSISATLMDPHFNYVGYGSYDSAISVYNDNLNLSTTSSGPTLYGVDTLIVMKGQIELYNPNNSSTNGLVFGSAADYNDYINPPATPTPTPEPKWYQEMWDTLSDELGQPEFWFGEWFIDIIDQVFNNEDESSQGPSGLSHSTHINQVTPAPTPTPIPYSTITVPRTDIINNTTVYETQYVYTSSSGDTIIATSPPTNTPSQNPSSGGGGSGSDYNPIDPYSIPEVSWFTSAEIGDTSYDGIDSIMQGFDSIDTIGEDYTDGMSAAEDSMGLLPTSWLLLIGVAAAIPLIAGIISRFLS